MRKSVKAGHKNFIKGLFKRKEYLSHTYEYSVSGEDLPEQNVHVLNAKFWLLGAVLTITFTILLLYLGNALWVLISRLFSTLFSNQPPTFTELLAGFLLQKRVLPQLATIIFFLAAIIIAAIIVLRIKFKTAYIAYGQKGDSRFATLREIKEQFKAIPQAGKTFPGYGGAPVSHYENQYYIEDGAYNTEYIGTSRSGKGQTAVLTLLDNLSRAQNQSALIVGDPKGELYAAMHDTLVTRGYEVYSYNLIDPIKSMGDDPLALIKKYYRRGNTEYALQLINTLTFTIYNDPDAGQNKFFNTSAAKVVNALILVLLQDAAKTGDWDKVTMNNVAEMLTEVGKINYQSNPDDPNDFVVKNALDELFNSLPPGDIAAKQYVGANFSGDKAKGSILSTVAEKLTPFTMPSIAKMTSRASIDLKSIGFPKYLDFRVDDNLVNQHLLIKFWNHKNKKLIGVVTAAVGVNGFVEVNFDYTLESGDLVEISHEQEQTTYSVKLSTEEKKHQVQLTPLKQNLEIKTIEMNYNDKPTAIFLMLPDYDPSNHVLASLFISSAYTELSYQCARTKGGKCFRRISWVLDEFGNLPAIANMDQNLTVTNGRNMLWHLFVQSDSQIFGKYGQEAGKTIIGNCQTRIMIMTTDSDSIEEFSKAVGNKTSISQNSDVNEMYNSRTISASADSERLITPERISQLLEGETVVLRPLHRRDLKGRKVRPFPIFNTKETAMPYAYQFLIDYGIDPSKDINEMEFDSPNANLDLNELRIDFTKFLVDDQAKKEYLRGQKAN
ncbi:VirD4-like conjugal transfer protein, CD1115 family [Bombilactobacillus bombi]|uniref:VirD4-like conjugal transfer protein, CD1115 family n=1 Tax=Bombilactobacillus bombi TaxID=1303590 RepID=UPI0035E83593